MVYCESDNALAGHIKEIKNDIMLQALILVNLNKLFT